MSRDSGAEELDTVHSELEHLRNEIRDAGEERLKRFGERVEEMRDLLSRAGTEELPHKGAIRTAAKSLASKIQEDFEQGLLGEDDVEMMDPVFAKLKYAEVDAAEEELQPAKRRAGVLKRYREKRGRYRDLHKQRRRELSRVEERLDETRSDLERLKSLGDVEELARELESLDAAVEQYDSARREALKRFLERDAPDVIRLALHADYFPETEPPRIGDREAARRLAEEAEGFTVYDLLEFERLSDGKKRHLVEEPERLETLLSGNLAWLRELSSLDEGGFLAVDPERPASVEEKAPVLRRFLRRIDGPVEELDAVVGEARSIDDAALKARRVSKRAGSDPAEAKAALRDEVGRLEKRAERLRNLLRGLTPPEDLQSF